MTGHFTLNMGSHISPFAEVWLKTSQIYNLYYGKHRYELACHFFLKTKEKIIDWSFLIFVGHF